MDYQPQIPEEARQALRQRGSQLLSKLDAMREQESAPAEVEALDPQAELALRKRGDEFLGELESMRPQRGRRRRLPRWLSVAALFVGIGFCAMLVYPKTPPAPVSVVKTSGVVTLGPDGQPILITDAAIPEPSSALLLMTGAVVLIGRRRRP